MSTQATAATPAIDPNDPRLYEPIDPSWKPIIPWDELNLDRDRRSLVEGLVARGMLPKADGVSTCGAFFRKILEFSDHWARVGRTTCHLMSCRNCGRGKMRAHRIYVRDEVVYVMMVEQDSRTMRLSITYADSCPDKITYRQRVQRDKRYLAAFRRRLRRKFGKDAGTVMSVELDPKLQDSIFRVYYVGPTLHHNWIAENWQQIVGLRAQSTSKWNFRDKSPDALRDTLDSLVPILMLPGDERAAWEEAFTGFRLTASSGSLRGAHPEREVEDGFKSKDPDAPWGRCPCGCNGIIEKPAHHAPLTLAQLSQQYEELDFGPLKYYGGSSGKVTSDLVRYMDHLAETHPEEPFPPFSGRWGPS